VLFAVRPCDARAVQLNAQLLSSTGDSQYQDVYFTARREKLLLVGYGCAQPGVACFCQATGGGPYDHQGLDVIVTDLGEKLLFQLLDKGYGLSSRLLLEKDLFSEASSDELRAAEDIAGRAQNCLAGQPVLAPAAGDLTPLFELPLWAEIAKRCLNCGICTYLCPTCTCFDMLDQSIGGRVSQYRCWDSCMFSLFTLHASGHNPRPERKHRVRQRFLHKLRYFPDQHGGVVSCSGCGRCVLHCPVNIDIREISKAIS
jgi:ferredoxin